MTNYIFLVQSDSELSYRQAEERETILDRRLLRKPKKHLLIIEAYKHSIGTQLAGTETAIKHLNHIYLRGRHIRLTSNHSKFYLNWNDLYKRDFIVRKKVCEMF